MNDFQLCHAVVYLVLQMTSWTTPIQDLIQKFQPQDEQDNYHTRVLLEILNELCKKLSFLKKTRGATKSELLKLFAASSEDILRLLVLPNCAPAVIILVD